MTNVLVFGTFDGLHPGHIHFLEQAKSYGDFLYVVVARDMTVFALKHKKPLHSEKERLKHLQENPHVHKAVLGSIGNKYEVIQDIKPDVICLGYDQNSFTTSLPKELKNRGMDHVKIIRLKPHKPEVYKSSIINK